MVINIVSARQSLQYNAAKTLIPAAINDHVHTLVNILPLPDQSKNVLCTVNLINPARTRIEKIDFVEVLTMNS
jgi:hypothetical protein